MRFLNHAVPSYREKTGRSFKCRQDGRRPFLLRKKSALLPIRTAQRVLTSFFCDTQGMAKKYAHMANTYTVRIGSARGVDCRCFCCFAGEKFFSPSRWRLLLGLFQLKTYAKAVLGHAKPIYRPPPHHGPRVRSHSAKKQHADTRNR